MDLNRSYRGHELRMLKQKQQQQGVKEREDELALFLEMRRHEKELELGDDGFLFNGSEELDAPLESSNAGTSPIFDIESSLPAHKNGVDDFLNLENDKNDYEWLLTPPGTPLFPSLEMESQTPNMHHIAGQKSNPTATRFANPQQEPGTRSILVSKSLVSTPGSTSSAGTRRPSSSGGPGSRPGTPSARPASNSASKTSRPSTPTSQSSLSSIKPAVSVAKSTVPGTKSITSTIKPNSLLTKSTVPSRSSTPSRSTARSSTPSRSTVISSTPSRSTARSSSPSRSTARSSTPSRSSAIPVTPSKSSAISGMPSKSSTISPTTSKFPAVSSTALRSTARSSTPLRSTARSSTPSRSTARSSIPTIRSSLPPSRAGTPTRRPSIPSSVTSKTTPPIRSSPSTSKNPVPSHGASTVKSRPWKPSEMPGFSLDAPPNLRTTLPDRPLSASRGRPAAPSPRSSSVEPGSIARARRQSCSPSRGRLPNGKIHTSGSSVPAISRQPKVSDNVSPVIIGTKMVERVVNMRKLEPPKADGKHSPNMNGKSSLSPDSSGFGRTLSKKSLDMAMRHMDIRRSIPGNLRPLMTNIPASSMYSVRSGPPRSRSVSVTNSPIATSSNASSEVSVNNGICLDGSEVDDDIGSERRRQSPAIMQSR